MSHEKETTPNKVEQDFNAAIDRLVRGRPTNRELARKAEAGTLRVTKVAVATEAGRSRVTLDRYPAVLARIADLADRPVATSGEVIGRLREENAALKRDKQAALDTASAMLLRMRATEKSTDQEVRKALRRAARPEANRVVGPTNQVVNFNAVADQNP